MKVKELIKLVEECNEDLVVKAPNSDIYLGEVSGIYFRGNCYELVVAEKYKQERQKVK